MNVLEIAESYINGNISEVKSKIKRMSKYDVVQFIFRLQDLGVNDQSIEKLFY